MVRPCFKSVTSLIMLCCGGFTSDGSAVMSGSLREFNINFLFVSIQGLVKASTQRNSVVT